MLGVDSEPDKTVPAYKLVVSLLNNINEYVDNVMRESESYEDADLRINAEIDKINQYYLYCKESDGVDQFVAGLLINVRNIAHDRITSGAIKQKINMLKEND